MFVHIVVEIFAVFSVTVTQCMPYIFDAIIFKNETSTMRRRLIVLLSKYYAIQEKYILIIILHMNAACTIGSLALVATGTIMITCIKHICGMFRIAR